MCGLFGIAASGDRKPSIGTARAAQLRDAIAHRGPDGAGLWHDARTILAHRRLAVIDPGPGGDQPMVGPRGSVLIYNGELYNDKELRAELIRLGARFRTQCDTETVLCALEQWGAEALPKLRGMFALAWYEPDARRLTLARDALGVKPMYYHIGSHEVVFCSALGPMFGVPSVPCQPFLPMVSTYLTTIRTVMGGWTMFDGVRAVQPGEVVTIDLSGDVPRARIRTWAMPVAEIALDEEAGADRVRESVSDSVARHLRSDVQVCALLSGGLDSTIVATLANGSHEALRTYCAGAREEVAEPGALDDDLKCAARMAKMLGTDHGEAIVTREHFGAQWPSMVRAIGMPLSTPNEVAIHAVASRLRADGCVVTLSGEGADELFGGYERAHDAAAEFYARRAAGDESALRMAPGRFEVQANSWMTRPVKGAVLDPRVWHALETDAWMDALGEAEYDAARGDAQGLQAHLRYMRRVNLQGLLQRLDTATMLAGVEGRTPFADAVVAQLAEALPLGCKYEAPSSSPQGDDDGGVGLAVATVLRTKRVLRRAFRDVVPRYVLERPKASFPLPFERWIEDNVDVLKRSMFARELFSSEAIATVCAAPTEHWNLAWPMVNVAMWGECHWG
ncbi:MAG: asparagine synthase (glutamine-hydrolyzing) [Phycisphaerales bacterium]|nr:asparagine synthase (glutamine-hydrolyzing) [Phycisphaerales bacterium]